MAASSTSFNVGRDCSLVIMGPFGRVDLSHVIGFNAHQTVNKVRVKRLNNTTLGRDLPGGWEGTFEVERANSNLDDLGAAIEAAFWTGLAVPVGTIYQYITELDNSTSTYQFDNVTVNLSQAGNYQQETAVKMQMEFFASRRRRI